MLPIRLFPFIKMIIYSCFCFFGENNFEQKATTITKNKSSSCNKINTPFREKNVPMRQKIIITTKYNFYLVRKKYFNKKKVLILVYLWSLYKGFARRHVIASFFLAAETLFLIVCIVDFVVA